MRLHIKTFIAFLVIILVGRAWGATPPPATFGPVPSARQLAWHEMEYYALIHFSLNTFADKEWGYGDEDPNLFAPTALDARQWARVAKGAGMKGIILVARHHDGFCLWPSVYTEYSIKNAPWKNGRGDVVGELAAACREYGLKMGIYLSPWDRNRADYGRGTYLTYYRNQLRELLTNYGELFEVWFDGANGGSGYYGGAREDRQIDRKTYYQWPDTRELVRQLQPNACMFSDAGPDCRWVGNEKGLGSETNWARLDLQDLYPGFPGYQVLGEGHRDGTSWVPAEADVPLRPGWFYHADQDDKVKSLKELLDIYYASVGRGCNLNIGLAPDRRGLIHENDAARLRELGRVLKRTFAVDLAQGQPVQASNVRGGDEAFSAAHLTDGDHNTYWAADDDVRSAELTVELDKPTRFNRIRLEEKIELGQRIEAFEILAGVGNLHQIAEGTTIGPRRILQVPTVLADRVTVRITQSRACPTLSTLELYVATAESAIKE